MLLFITILLSLASMTLSIAVIRDMRKADAWRRHCAKVDADAVINSWYDNREYEEYV